MLQFIHVVLCTKYRSTASTTPNLYSPHLSLSIPLQIPMQLMLLDKCTRHRRAHRESQRSNPHAPETLHISFQHALVPSFRQAMNLIDRIADSTDFLLGARQPASYSLLSCLACSSSASVSCSSHASPLLCRCSSGERSSTGKGSTTWRSFPFGLLPDPDILLSRL